MGSHLIIPVNSRTYNLVVSKRLTRKADSAFAHPQQLEKGGASFVYSLVPDALIVHAALGHKHVQDVVHSPLLGNPKI
jgi:hypothetical protein